MKSEIKQLLRRASAALQNDSTTVERKQILEDIEKKLKTTDGDTWWVIVLKVIAYAIGLLLAGYGTTAATMSLLRFF